MAILTTALGAQSNQMTASGVTVGSFPTPVTIDSETLDITGGSGTSADLYSVTRGTFGTARAGHANGASITVGLGGGGGGGSISATDGSTTVDPATSLSFPAGSVTDAGGGVADIAAPTLAQVLAAGNLAGGQKIQGTNTAVPFGVPASLFVQDFIGGVGGQAELQAGVSDVGVSGQPVTIAGGAEGSFDFNAAYIVVGGSTAAAHGKLDLNTDNSDGVAGQFLGSDGAGMTAWQTPLVRIAAGVPSGAPGVAELPIAVDTTAVSGGIYAWSGSAWVKAATI